MDATTLGGEGEPTFKPPRLGSSGRTDGERPGQRVGVPAPELQVPGSNLTNPVPLCLGRCGVTPGIDYDTHVRFADTLRSVRRAAGLTQAELGVRAGVARPNVAAYEAGRREPLFESAVGLLGAAGAEINIEPPLVWSWTEGLRPYAVPSRLWRLAPEVALRRFEPGVTLWWSGPPRTFDLSERAERCRLYEIVLREGRPVDIEGIVDGVLLCEAWPDLVVPRGLAAAWTPLVVPERQTAGRFAS